MKRMVSLSKLLNFRGYARAALRSTHASNLRRECGRGGKEGRWQMDGFTIAYFFPPNVSQIRLPAQRVVARSVPGVLQRAEDRRRGRGRHIQNEQ